LIDASQPGLACQGLILDIPHVYFEFAVGFHAGNLQQSSVDLQGPANRVGTEANLDAWKSELLLKVSGYEDCRP
jgi:hypothetical protein